MRKRLFGIALGLMILASSTQAGSAAPPPPDLDLSGYQLTFHDEFDELRVTRDGGKGLWFAPIHGPVGAAKFLNPDPGGPFSVANGALTIRATKDAQGAWRSGFMQSVDSKARGFSQKYGYFEMRAKLPMGAATWPAFWLLTVTGHESPRTTTRGEIDIVEAYGNQPNVLHYAVHLRRPNDPHWYMSKQVRANVTLEGFHTYGAMITAQWIIFYFDGKETYRFPTLEEYKVPLYVLVDLAMQPLNLSKAVDPSDMEVDYVRVYAEKPPVAAPK